MTTEEAELWRQKAAGSTPARERLIHLHRPLVVHLRKKRFPRGPEVSAEDVKDLETAGLTGLIHAIDRYTSERGVWARYASMCIVGYMLDLYPKLRGLSGEACKAGGKRSPGRSAWRTVPLDDPEARPDGIPDPASGDAADRLLNANELRAALASLPEPQARLLWLHDAEGMSLAGAAREIGLPQATVGATYRTARTALKAAIVAAGYLESVEKPIQFCRKIGSRRSWKRFRERLSVPVTSEQKAEIEGLSKRMRCSEAEVVRRLVAQAAALGESASALQSR